MAAHCNQCRGTDLQAGGDQYHCLTCGAHTPIADADVFVAPVPAPKPRKRASKKS